VGGIALVIFIFHVIAIMFIVLWFSFYSKKKSERGNRKFRKITEGK